jgi:sarcosine oxidase subunit beta
VPGTHSQRLTRVDDPRNGGAGRSYAAGVLPPSSEAVVIGGGVVGASTLYHLAALGCERPLLVERETLGSGSTGRCAGGVRPLVSDYPLDLRLWGYLFLLTRAEDVAGFEAAAALQRRIGVETRLVGADEAAAIVPQLEVGDVLAAAFCPRAGYVTPDLVVQGYARRAGELGARIVQSCAAERILVEGGRVVGVETEQGAVATERVVLAAGVWSEALAETVGLPLPIEPEARWLFFTDAAPGFPRELPSARAGGATTS